MHGFCRSYRNIGFQNFRASERTVLLGTKKHWAFKVKFSLLGCRYLWTALFIVVDQYEILSAKGCLASPKDSLRTAPGLPVLYSFKGIYTTFYLYVIY